MAPSKKTTKRSMSKGKTTKGKTYKRTTTRGKTYKRRSPKNRRSIKLDIDYDEWKLDLQGKI
jgi:hypothetical protein